MEQTKNRTNKVYSIHEPHVKCISKGKSHKKYEFGCKVSFVKTHKKGILLNAKAIHKNPYDGQLEKTLPEAENITQTSIEDVFVDKGYRSNKVQRRRVFISGQKNLTRHFKKLLKRRQSIELHIGHMKQDGKLGRNYLKGDYGDKLNAVLSVLA